METQRSKRGAKSNRNSIEPKRGVTNLLVTRVKKRKNRQNLKEHKEEFQFSIFDFPLFSIFYFGYPIFGMQYSIQFFTHMLTLFQAYTVGILGDVFLGSTSIHTNIRNQFSFYLQLIQFLFLFSSIFRSSFWYAFI